jgi:hypothetical protein
MIANLTPGLHNLSSDIYHADPCPVPSLSSSIANILLTQSPAHAWLAHPRLNPRHVREVDSRFDLGSAAHSMLLERRTDALVIVDADDWRTKAAREARDQAQAQGKYAILARQFADVEKMVTAAHKYVQTTELADILDTGVPEQSLVWQEGNMWCRARPDLMSVKPPVTVVLDYKTTESAAPADFAKQIGRMGYDLQSEFYTRGFSMIGAEVLFIFLVQEINPPYACSLISLSNAYREVGQLKVNRALKVWERCMFEKSWPGYETRVLYAEPKPWDLIEAEQESTNGL